MPLNFCRVITNLKNLESQRFGEVGDLIKDQENIRVWKTA